MKAIIGFVAFVALVIFVVVIVARGGNDTGQKNLEPVPKLSEAAASAAKFSLIEQGPIVAEEEHYRVNITIGRDSREIVVYRGYDEVKVASKTFSNSQGAFEEFLSAIDRAGFTTVRRTSLDSEAGLCPTRRRYVLESNYDNKEFRRWTTDCREKGDFGGVFATIRTLFRNQIPNYNSFISETRVATGLSL